MICKFDFCSHCSLCLCFFYVSLFGSLFLMQSLTSSATIRGAANAANSSTSALLRRMVTVFGVAEGAEEEPEEEEENSTDEEEDQSQEGPNANEGSGLSGGGAMGSN